MREVGALYLNSSLSTLRPEVTKEYLSKLQSEVERLETQLVSLKDKVGYRMFSGDPTTSMRPDPASNGAALAGIIGNQVVLGGDTPSISNNGPAATYFEVQSQGNLTGTVAAGLTTAMLALVSRDSAGNGYGLQLDSNLAIGGVGITAVQLGTATAPVLQFRSGGTILFSYNPATNTINFGTGSPGQVAVQGDLQVIGNLLRPNWPASRAVVTAGQTIPDSVWTSLAFTVNSFDTGGVHSTTVNTSRFTVPAGQAGVYLVVGGCIWTQNATGERAMRILFNGGTSRDQATQMAAPVTDYTIQNVAVILSLAAGDYIEFQGWQNSGAVGGLVAGAQPANTDVHFGSLARIS